MLSIIVAMANRRVIGYHNQIPWHLPVDLRHFMTTTRGKTVVMGHNTLKSLGKALPGRRNIVLTRSRDLQIAGCEVAHDLDAVISEIESEEEAFIIGGSYIYEQALPKVDRMYLTFVQADVVGDTFFPPWDESLWEPISERQHPADEHNAYACHFVTFQRIFSA